MPPAPSRRFGGRLLWTSLVLGLLVALCGQNITGAAQVTREPAPPPDGWRAGVEVRAAAHGPAGMVREFIWGQDLQPVTGVFRLSAVDNTWADDRNSQDRLLEGVARVRVPASAVGSPEGDEAEYLVRFQRLVPWHAERPTFGGVLVNHPMFGDTGIGGPGLFPRLRAHLAVWGYAEVSRNGRRIGENRFALAWVGEAPREPDGRWRYEADPDRMTAHVLVFGSLGGGSPLPETPDGFLHFEWPQARVVTPEAASGPAAPPRAASAPRS
jgi:hypothetical protein